MERNLLFGFVLVLAVAASAQDPCPKSCSCTPRSYDSDIARCSVLDSNLQRFSSDVASLVVKNAPSSDTKFYLRDNIFADLGLNTVRSIEIINSSLRAVDVNAFHGLRDISDIDLSNNKLVRLVPETFSKLTALRRLRLSGNPLWPHWTKDVYFLDSGHITELELSHCNIVQLSHSTFSKLNNLEHLDLSYNKLKEIDSDLFKPMAYLEEVNLNFNEIEYISPDTFADIEEMTKLKLRGNPLRSLEELNLPDLTELDVSQCQLKGLFSNSLEGVPQLSFLNLSNNAIETIEPDAFSSLVELAYLYLSNNDLKGPISQFTFEHNTMLEVLSFSGNPNFKSLNGFMGEFTGLYTLDISYCGLEEITNKSFSGMNFIATLNVSGNQLQHVDSKTFSKLKRLTTLDLSNNELRYLPPKVFSTNDNLQKLYLGSNQFHHLPAVLFINTPALYSLDVRNNRLGYLWNVSESVMMKSKGVLRNLVYLNVAGNRLKKLHLQNFISLKKLGQLDISDNPIECSSSFGHVMEWLILHRVLPNRKHASHPVSISDDIYNNVQWDETLKSVCPLPVSEPIKMPEQKANIISVSIKPIPEVRPSFDRLSASSSEIPTVDQVEYIGIEENKYIWPLTLVAFAALCLILALGNIAFLMVYKARRNYRLVSYKSHFPNPLGGLSQVRHKHAPVYQKLYEDCSVPKTPIVKNTHGKCMVTCIADPEKAEAV